MPFLMLQCFIKFFDYLTGYSRCEVLGRNSKFLNGPGTCSKALQQVHSTQIKGLIVRMVTISLARLVI